VLAEREGITPDEAFAELSRMSQRTNVRLADLAASLLAALVSVRPAGDVEGSVASDKPTPVPVRFAAAYRRVAAAADAATDLTALAAALGEAGLGTEWICFYSATADGVRRLAAFGARIAPRSGETLDAVAADVVALGQPISRSPARGAHVVAHPLYRPNGVAGVLAFGFGSVADSEAVDRGYMGALVQLAQRVADRLWPGQTHPIAPALDASFTPALLLVPLRDPAGEVIDFLIAHANPAVPDMTGLSRADQIGRRLLDVYPHLLASGVFDAYRKVLETGEPYERGISEETVVVAGAPAVVAVSRRAVRYESGVLVTWRREERRMRRDRQMHRMEVLGNFGWADWDLAGRQTYWSPGMYRVFGRDPQREPVPIASLAALVRPADRDAVEAMVAEVTGGRPATAEFRLVGGGDDERHLRLIAEPRAVDDGRVVGALAVAQDLTETRRADERMLRVQAQLAEQRLRLAAARDLTRELRRVLYPSFDCEVRTAGAWLAGRHAAPDDDRHLRGDFCDASLTGDGHILFAIGDSFGTGARAGEVLARLLYPARALGIAGVPPATILDILNRDLHRDELPPLASIVVGRYCPARCAVSWAQAGHLPPIRLRDGGTRILERPAGPAVGLLPEAEFAESSLPCRGGDMVVWMTDGMVFERSRPDVDPWPGLRRRLAAARAGGGLADVLSLCVAPAGDEACMVVLDIGQEAGRAARCPSPACG
jgi:PAS domain-containing protein